MWIRSTLPATRIYGAGNMGLAPCKFPGKDQNYPGASFLSLDTIAFCAWYVFVGGWRGALLYMVRCVGATSWVSSTFLLQLWQPQIVSRHCQMSPGRGGGGWGQHAKVLWLSNRPGVIRPEPMELMSWEEGCQNVPNRYVQVLLKTLCSGGFGRHHTTLVPQIIIPV